MRLELDPRMGFMHTAVIAVFLISFLFLITAVPTVHPDPRKPRWEQVPADGLWVSPDTTGGWHRLPQGAVIQIPHWTAPPSVGHKAEGDA